MDGTFCELATHIFNGSSQVKSPNYSDGARDEVCDRNGLHRWLAAYYLYPVSLYLLQESEATEKISTKKVSKCYSAIREQ